MHAAYAGSAIDHSIEHMAKETRMDKGMKVLMAVCAVLSAMLIMAIVAKNDGGMTPEAVAAPAADAGDGYRHDYFPAQFRDPRGEHEDEVQSF
jgi:hypothetical protein